MSRHSGPATVALTPFTAAAAGAIGQIEVHVARPAPTRLLLEYELRGDLAGVLIASPGAESSGGEPDGRTDGLWRHTCMEVFISTGPTAPGPYLEINLAPGGQWAAYRFSGYRAGMAPLTGIHPPRIELRTQPERLLLAAEVTVPDDFAATTLWLGLTAVVEDAQRQLRYWALRHAADRPDFHHPDSFEFEI
ncbi:MAG TPA: DOMON-like domain-containing protein [Steroidobacteraceae bacterium]|nr:DOMON-like domain-containing protein [Steroidobacteraceae bacterium]